ncbi:MAG TPA: glycoside hydrolase family 9 protein, partial [Longimicrobiales bacterium]
MGFTPCATIACALLAATLLAPAGARASTPARADTANLVIRVNQVGYLPDAPKVAVLCALRPEPVKDFVVLDEQGRRVFGPRAAEAAHGFGPCAGTWRLDFSALRQPGRYRLQAAGATSPLVRIGADVYAGGLDTLLSYMRVQRSGFNPFFKDSVHNRTDAILVDHPEAGKWIDVSGGWADAADYLQYATTSANATYVMLMAARDYPTASPDLHRADGLPGADGVPDILDEARHGLEWLVKMYPRDDLILNQIGDDRDHTYWDLPTTDSSDYGWGRRGPRAVYPCTGRPQGLGRYQNHSTGYASTAGKFASAMALGAQLFRERDRPF